MRGTQGGKGNEAPIEPDRDVQSNPKRSRSKAWFVGSGELFPWRMTWRTDLCHRRRQATCTSATRPLVDPRSDRACGLLGVPILQVNFWSPRSFRRASYASASFGASLQTLAKNSGGEFARELCDEIRVPLMTATLIPLALGCVQSRFGFTQRSKGTTWRKNFSSIRIGFQSSHV